MEAWLRTGNLLPVGGTPVPVDPLVGHASRRLFCAPQVWCFTCLCSCLPSSLPAADISKARTDLLLSRMRFILFYGAALYPLFVLLDWHERPWDRATALIVRVGVAVLVLGLAQLNRTAWGRSRALSITSAGFLLGQAGFVVIVWHAKGLGTSDGYDFDLFFGPYCVLVPATVGWTALIGAAMLGIQLATFAVSGAAIHYGELAWRVVPGFVVFLTARHVANVLEIAWRREFVERAALEDALTDLRAAQDKLVQSEKMAALGRLTAGVAHELNNPLFVIGTNLGVIQDAVDALGTAETPPSIREKLTGGLERLRSALGRTSGVSDLLRHFSAPPTHKDTPTDVNAVVEMSISLVAMASKRKEVEIHRDFGNLPLFPCDPQSISQVFVNLLQNAFDAVNERGTVCVSTRAEPDGSIVALVRDDGAGIPAENLPKITEPFFTTKAPGDGMGLGLAIANSVVEKYGGTLAFSSGNPGTIATVTLPSRSPAH